MARSAAVDARAAGFTWPGEATYRVVGVSVCCVVMLAGGRRAAVAG